MSSIGQPDSQTVSVANVNDLHNILCGCRDTGKLAVTIDSPVLQSHNWQTVHGALRIDLSAMNQMLIDPARRLALAGPGTKISTIANEARAKGLMADIEPLACIDFTMGDWAHESLRLLSAINSGIDGILRNVKVTAPDISYQTGYDNFPANGGGYDLTKMFMASSLTLGVPYEFAIPLRPIPDLMVKKIYSFEKPGVAIAAGALMHKTGFARTIKIRSGGFDGMLISGSTSEKTKEDNLVVKIEGNQTIIDAAEKALDEIASKHYGTVKERVDDIPKYIDPASISSSAWLLGVCIVDTQILGSMINDLTVEASGMGKELQYCISDLDPNVSVLVPLTEGPVSSELVRSVGTHLNNHRITLRGNPLWNPILGDSRAPPRIEVLREIKKIIDSRSVLNPHVMGVL